MLVQENLEQIKSVGCGTMDYVANVIARAEAYHNLTADAKTMLCELKALNARKTRATGASAKRLRQRCAKLENELGVVELLDLLRNIVLNTADGEKFSFLMNNGHYALCVDGVSRGAFFTMQYVAGNDLPQWIDGVPYRAYFAEFTAALDPKLLGRKVYPKPITNAARWIFRNGGVDFTRLEHVREH